VTCSMTATVSKIANKENVIDIIIDF